MKFLSSMAPDWNISLFHYRAARGLQLDPRRAAVPQADRAEFERFLAALGYPYVEESANPAYRLFLS